MMNELQLVVEVIMLFLVRIGLPMLILIVIGVLIDHWQNKREQNIVRTRGGD